MTCAMHTMILKTNIGSWAISGFPTGQEARSCSAVPTANRCCNGKHMSRCSVEQGGALPGGALGEGAARPGAAAVRVARDPELHVAHHQAALLLQQYAAPDQATRGHSMHAVTHQPLLVCNRPFGAVHSYALRLRHPIAITSALLQQMPAM